MDKSRVCVTKTINLAKDACTKKQNLLVYERKNDPCEYKIPKVDPKFLPRISPATPKKIRICTGAELKKMCPPRLCKCPNSKSVGFFGQIWNMIGFGVKGIFALALVYWTYDVGLWGPSDDTERLYKDMCNTITPMLCPEAEPLDEDELKSKPEKSKVCQAQEELKCVNSNGEELKCCKSPPSIEENSNTLKDYYNKFVVCTFDLLVHGPEKVAHLYELAVAKYHEMTDKGESEEEKNDKDKEKDKSKNKDKKKEK